MTVAVEIPHDTRMEIAQGIINVLNNFKQTKDLDMIATVDGATISFLEVRHVDDHKALELHTPYKSNVQYLAQHIDSGPQFISLVDMDRHVQVIVTLA